MKCFALDAASYVTKKVLLITSFIPALCLSCSSDEHLISDASERAVVECDFKARREELAQGGLFRVFNQPMSVAQREAMVFLYAYMPLSDLADHEGEFFLENVVYAFRARKEMPWGRTVPEREFRHFVLPVRVNNEDLDGSRRLFFEELRERVCGLSMYDAVMEVNHWCHEKVTYRPTDARTSGPLASVRTAYGRCGEESTLTVAALRSVGIPARQVYTPRWAHTDDNHAWVEAWVDGAWYFLGACEPEPVLNLAWFNVPASRGMLMHTKVFGAYDGPEEVMSQTPRYTEINVTDNYAPTARASVTVVDPGGRPVSGAKVEFKVYNYAEFYTVATRLTDSAGNASLTAGLGDMLVWATKDGRFGCSKLSFGSGEALVVRLDHEAGEPLSIALDIVPPVASDNMPEVTAEQRAANDCRLAEEDSARAAYESTFLTDSAARVFAYEQGLDPDTTAMLLVASRGNYEVISNFLSQLRTAEEKRGGIDLLRCLSAKDLRDVVPDVLTDHLRNSRSCPDAELFGEYVRNPRVSNEMITPYKAFFTSELPSASRADFRAEPARLVSWVAQNIRVDNDCNLGGPPISPVGVWKARLADAHSRDIFFVSMARSLGIPARIDAVTGKVQLMCGGQPSDVSFEARAQARAVQGRLVARYTPSELLSDPRYYAHFTLSRLTAEGSLRLLNYAEADGEAGGTTWSGLLREGTSLDAGDYVLTTGTRFADGNVLANLAFFTVRGRETTVVDMQMRANDDDLQVIGSFNSELTFQRADGGGETSFLSAAGRGYFIVAVLGAGQEPTNHALCDIAALGRDFEEWGRRMVLLFPEEEKYRKFSPQEFPGLPSTVIYGIDSGGTVRSQIAEVLELSSGASLPLFLVADTFNRVVFVSQGYTIGLGEQLIKVVHKL